MRSLLWSVAVAAGLQLGLTGCRPEPRLAELRPTAPANLGRPSTVVPAGRPAPAVPTAVATAPATAGEVQLRLPSGALLVLQEDHIVKTVALQAWVGAGAADEPEERLGIAHLTERLLFQEQAQDLVLRVHQSGGEAASWTTPDHTVFQVLVPSSRWRQGTDLLGAVLGSRRAELGISEAALLRQREAILAELRQEAAVPQRASMQALLGLAFAVHPYRRPLLGRADTLSKLGRAEVAEFFARRYTPARLTLVVTGDFDSTAVAERLNAELATSLVSVHGAGSESAERSLEPPQLAPRVAVLTQDAEPGRARVLLGFHVPAARSPDIAALEVAAVLLGYGEGARLPRELSRTQRLDGSEEPSAVSYTARDPGLFLAGLTVAPAQLEEAARVLTSEALRLGQREVSAADLQRAQRVLLADAAYLRETPTGRARRLGFFHSLGLSPTEHDRQVQVLTPLTLRQALGRYLTPENLTLIALRPRPASSTLPSGRADTTAPDSSAGLLRKLQLQVVQSAAPLRPLRPAPVPTKVQQVQAGVFEYTLPSGTRLLIVPEHSVEIVGIAAMWPGGLRVEDERTAGAHQLLSRLWPRTARARTAEAVARELEQISGTLQPVVELDAFGLRAELVSSHLDQGLALLADCLSQPSFTDADADRERRSLIVELRGELRAAAPALVSSLEPLGPSSEATVAQLLPRDDAATAALRLFKGALLPGHPYALEPSVQSVGGLSRRRLLELFRRSYPLSKLTIAVVGDVDPATVVERLEARLPAALSAAVVAAPAVGTTPAIGTSSANGTSSASGTTPASGTAPAIGTTPAVSVVAAPVGVPEPPEPRTPLQQVAYLPGQHAHMVLGFRAPGLHNPERYAIEVLFELLAGPAGRLTRELKDRRGLAYAVQGVMQLGLDPGFLAFHLAASPSTFEVAQTGLREELRKLLDHPVPQAELALAQDRLISQKSAGRQRREGRALELARAAALALAPGEASTEAYEAGVRAVSPEVVQRAARHYLSDQRAVIAAVLPESLQRHPQVRPALAELMRTHEAVPAPALPGPLPKGIKLASRSAAVGIATSRSSHAQPGAGSRSPSKSSKSPSKNLSKSSSKNPSQTKPAHKH